MLSDFMARGTKCTIVVEEGLAIPDLDVVRAEETWVEGSTCSMGAILELCAHPGEVLPLFLGGASGSIS